MTPIRLLAASFSLFLSACASSPAPLYLTLDVPTSSATVEAHQRIIVIGPVSVPEAVDRPQLMLNVGPNRLEAAANVRWAQPYKQEVARALAAYLAQTLANPLVVPASAATPTVPYWRVKVDVLTVDLREGSSVLLEVIWMVNDGNTGKPIASQRNVLTESVDGRGGEALAAAQSRAFAKLATQIAAKLVL